MLALGGRPDDDARPGPEVDLLTRGDLPLLTRRDRRARQAPGRGADEGAVGRPQILDEPPGAVGRELRVPTRDTGVAGELKIYAHPLKGLRIKHLETIHLETKNFLPKKNF